MLRNQANRQGLLLALVSLLLLASAADAELLPIKTFTIADGLPNYEINKIVRDSRGFLWLCTGDGLSRFDGYAFANFSTDQGLPHRVVYDLLETRNGEYWIATGGGLVLFTPQVSSQSHVTYAHEASSRGLSMFMTVLPQPESRGGRVVTALLEDQSGTIWCGTYDGLYRLDRTSLTLQPVEVGLPREGSEGRIINDLLEDQYHSLWIATPSGLYRRWADGGVAGYTKRDGLPDVFLHDLLVDHAGQFWAATRYHGFFRFTADGTRKPIEVVRSYAAADGLTTNWVFQLFETADRHFWIATNVGLVEFFPESEQLGAPHFHVYREVNGLSYHDITTINEDTGGNVWLGTNAAGAMKLERNGFITYDKKDKLYGVNAIFGSRMGAVCFRASVLSDENKAVLDGAKANPLGRTQFHAYTQLGQFDGRRFTWFKPKKVPDLGWLMEGITEQGHNGEWWVGTGGTIYRFPASDNFVSIKTSTPLAILSTIKLGAPQTYRFFEDSRGDLWISNMSGKPLLRWDRAQQTFHDVLSEVGLSSVSDLIRSFGEDRSGNIWMGFNGGLARYKNGSFTSFGVNEGLPPGAIISIFPDHAGRLWLASARSGLIRIDDPEAARPTFINYTTAQGLSSNSAEVFADHLITEDLQGHIYFGTSRGVDQLDPPTGHIKHFTTADGLASGTIKSAFCDRNGVLWFGTSQGLSKFAPAPEESPGAPPPILIDGVRIAGADRAVSALGETEITVPDLGADQNQMQISFVGLTFQSGDILRYQYRLEGAESDWSTPAEQRSVNYARLAPGRYRFLVRAMNSEGVVSDKPAFITFRILPPVWRRWWFLSAVAIMLLLILYQLYRYRLASLLELERVRTRIAIDLHDDIGSSLSRMAILSEVAKRRSEGTARDPGKILTEIADSARKAVDSMSDIVWAIDPRRDDLNNVVFRVRQFASDLLSAQGIVWQFHAPPDAEIVRLNPEQRRQIFLIFKEGINNSVRHANCSSVYLSLEVVHHQIIGEIRDDGCGFAVPALDQAPETGGAGHGLGNLRVRTKQLGGQLSIDSSIGHGTCIRLSIPCRKSMA
jgi:ligand-binding sensor domain-containing protein/signal transduction histidine kinase